MGRAVQFTRVDFVRFKAFKSFRLTLDHFNILVGPNNAGKSTVLSAFRILAAGIRRANQRKAQMLEYAGGARFGHIIDLSADTIADENIFYNYEDEEPASVTFTLSNGNQLVLLFPERGICYLIADDPSAQVLTPAVFRSRFNCSIGFVPILGPVEQHERVFEKEAARAALFNYRAARNFRNIWHHYPEHFDRFRELLRETWPGMDIQPPEIDTSYEKTELKMFCPEERIPREIFWAGFGFQVWCQMLTHLVQSADVSLFLIDEPDIYLHSDLQRQLLTLLRNLGPDILIATHSTEIIAEAEANDIVLIDKRKRSARRIKDPSQLSEVFGFLGSNLNPTLTQLAKTRRAVFVEGKDFQVLGKFARRLGLTEIGNRAHFAVVPVEGFSPDRIRSIKRGIETTLGGRIGAAAILDRDYRSDDECEAILESCEEFCDLVVIHACKEVENFLLVPAALDRAASRKLEERARRVGKTLTYSPSAGTVLQSFAASKKSYVVSQYLAKKRAFVRRGSINVQETTLNEQVLDELETAWADETRRLQLIPGKEAMSALGRHLQEKYSTSVTPSLVIDCMREEDVPLEVTDLLSRLAKFVKREARKTG